MRQDRGDSLLRAGVGGFLHRPCRTIVSSLAPDHGRVVVKCTLDLHHPRQHLRSGSSDCDRAHPGRDQPERRRHRLRLFCWRRQVDTWAAGRKQAGRHRRRLSEPARLRRG